MLATRLVAEGTGSTLGDLVQVARETGNLGPRLSRDLDGAIVEHGAAARTALELTGNPWRFYDTERLLVAIQRLPERAALA